MASQVIHSDLEKFLTGHIRAELLARGRTGGFISNEFSPPDKPRPAFQVIVRDDSGARTGISTRSASVGVTILGSDSVKKEAATELALLVCAIVEACPSTDPANPVAAVTDSNGPYKVPDDTGFPRRYSTFTLSVVGKAFS